jgi:cytochrome c-type biogenesis protein CcmH
MCDCKVSAPVQGLLPMQGMEEWISSKVIKPDKKYTSFFDGLHPGEPHLGDLQCMLRPFLVTLLLLIALAVPAVAAAQGYTLPPGVTGDEVNDVAREIWCPLCSGVRLDSCELKACEQMKEVIAIKLAEGEDTRSIKDYFLEQYGPQVLGEPPREGFNWLAWIVPFVVLVLGGVFFWQKSRQLVRPEELLEGGLPAPRPVNEHAPLAAPTTEVMLDPGGAPRAEGQTDAELQRKLDEELARYG